MIGGICRGVNSRANSLDLLEFRGHCRTGTKARIQAMATLKSTVTSATAAAKSLSDRPIVQPVLSKNAFLRRRAVEELTGLPRSSIYERIAAGTFPKPVPLGGRSVGWAETEIIEWQRGRIAERDRKQDGPRRTR